MFVTSSSSVNDLASLSRMPANTMFLAYFTAIENASAAFAPVKSVARAQAEMIGFISRRARACFEAPAQLTTCRNPHDILHEQMRFWNLAAEEYAETSRRVMEAWALPVSQSAPQAAAAAARSHDYIEFPVPRRPRKPAVQTETRGLEFA